MWETPGSTTWPTVHSCWLRPLARRSSSTQVLNWVIISRAENTALVIMKTNDICCAFKELPKSFISSGILLWTRSYLNVFMAFQNSMAHWKYNKGYLYINYLLSHLLLIVSMWVIITVSVLPSPLATWMELICLTCAYKWTQETGSTLLTKLNEAVSQGH